MNGTFASKKEVWITKWIDYSSKYGLGYILNNGYFGVYFNDNTKMLLNPKDQRFIYVERKITDKQESLFQFFLKDYPDILNNKVKLFVQFKKFLEEEDNNAKIKEKVKNNINTSPSKRKHKEKSDLKKSKSKENIGNDFSNVEVKETDFIFVKKWMNTKHAIIFRFSNKIIQTIFKDKTQVIIHSLNNNLTYINKKEEKIEVHLDKVFESNNYELIRRVKYIKEILTHMVNINKKNMELNSDKDKDKSITKDGNTKKEENKIEKNNK
jgi:polo-like kinase 1